MAANHPKILSLQENIHGRDFVVGDIHGAFDLLDQALKTVNFDKNKDRLIVVGDLIDRGAHSNKCHHYLSQPWFYAVKGNHEEMFMDFYQNGKLNKEAINKNLQHGFGWMLKEKKSTLDTIHSAFSKLPLAIEINTSQGIIAFVHADVPREMDWNTFKYYLNKGDIYTKKTAIWGTSRIFDYDTDGVEGVNRIFFGHNVVRNGPVALGNCFFIDTGAVFKHINYNNTENLFMTLADIKANAADICAPHTTKHPLVRTAIVKKPASFKNTP